MQYDAPLVLYVAPPVALAVLALAWWGRLARLRRAARWSADLVTVARAANRGVAAWLAAVALLVIPWIWPFTI